MRSALLLLFIVANGTLWISLDAPGAEKSKTVAFPEARPHRGSFSRPIDGEVSGVTPPGFSWWRAAPDGQVKYRLTIKKEGGGIAYASPLIDDPVHVPNRTLDTGSYTWSVEALDSKGEALDATPVKSFEVARDAFEQPWVEPRELLKRVPSGHPRLLFPKAELGAIRASLKTTRREAFEALAPQAERYLGMKPPAEPTYHKIEDRAKRRLGYFNSFQEMRGYHLGGMLHTALMYVMTGEAAYGQTAKAILLGATEWDPEGVSSILAPYGDEVGLGLVKSEALVYDWIHDLLNADEKRRVEAMLVARADQMLRRLQKRDFLSSPEESHNGRLPGYLVEHAMALAEHPRAEVWLEYGLKSIMTVFPHWAGRDGGWAEGLSYGMAYNTIFITPIESLRIATGMDVWKRPFYGRIPYFFFYNVSPRGEIMGFGDSYDRAVPGRVTSLRGLMQFHAEHQEDPAIRWWIDLLRDEDGAKASLPALHGLIKPQTIQPKPPADMAPDAVFRGVGWAALHSDLANPDDLFVAFKSSPYGGVSHSYADQNSFAILKGGAALARPGGSRYPQHGSPFHEKYTQQTVAQNSVL
ncbi:MAG: DUF4962 domain-containing protein, partial [Planctomycetota bacterium]